MEFLQEVSFHYDGDEELLSKADKKEERKSSEDKGKGKETQKSVVDLPNCSDIKEKRRGSIPGIGDGLVEEGRRGEDPLPPVVDNNTPVEPYLQANFTELGTCKFPDTTIQVSFFFPSPPFLYIFSDNFFKRSLLKKYFRIKVKLFQIYIKRGRTGM